MSSLKKQPVLSTGDSLIHLAADSKNLLIFQAVLNFYNSVNLSNVVQAMNSKNHAGQTPLQKMASNPNANEHIAQVLIVSGTISDEDRDIFGRTLIQAARNSAGNEKIVERILDYKNRHANPTKYLMNSLSMLESSCEIYDSLAREVYGENPPLVVQDERVKIARNLVDLSILTLVDDRLISRENKKTDRFSIAERCAEITDKYDPLTFSSIFHLRSFIDFARHEQEELLKEEAKRLEAFVLEDPKVRWQKYLNDLSPRTKSHFVDEFIRSGEDVSLSSRDGSSVLKCAIKKCGDSDSINAVLNSDNLSFEAIREELAREIKSKNRVAVGIILSNSAVISRVASFSGRDRESFFTSIKSTDSAISNLVKSFRSSVSALENAAVKTEAEEESKKPAISKNEAKRLKQARRQAEQEEEEARKQELKLAQEDLRRRMDLAFEEISREVVAEELASIVSEELVIKDLEQEIFSEVLEDFAKESSTKILNDLKSSIEDVSEFLREEKRIRSVDQLPVFLQQPVRDLVAREDVEAVSLKGSAVYQWDRTFRRPTDLDLEVKVKNISQWPAEEVVKFVKDHFDLRIDQSSIYRGRSGEETFSLNVKDDLKKIDISIYDPEKMPRNYRPFITNRESKVNFGRDGSAHYEFPEFAHQSRLVFQERTQGLIFRLSFLETCGVITKGELREAFQKLKTHPVELLSRELKISFVDPSNREEIQRSVVEKVNNFAESHNLEGDARKAFVDNLFLALETRKNERLDLQKTAKLVAEAIGFKSTAVGQLSASAKEKSVTK